jgi:hypothetical protein
MGESRASGTSEACHWSTRREEIADNQTDNLSVIISKAIIKNYKKVYNQQYYR